MADVTFLSASVVRQLFTKLRPVCVAGATPLGWVPPPFHLNFFFFLFAYLGASPDHMRPGKSFK